jgi:hypothetical protein
LAFFVADAIAHARPEVNREQDLGADFGRPSNKGGGELT